MLREFQRYSPKCWCVWWCWISWCFIPKKSPNKNTSPRGAFCPSFSKIKPIGSMGLVYLHWSHKKSINPMYGKIPIPWIRHGLYFKQNITNCPFLAFQVFSFHLWYRFGSTPPPTQDSSGKCRFIRIPDPKNARILVGAWRYIPVSKGIATPIYKPSKCHVERTIVINHLLNGMILQVG